LDQILKEIEEKAPILQQQRKDYEQALHSVDQLSMRLNSALAVGAQSWSRENCHTRAKKLLRDDEN